MKVNTKLTIKRSIVLAALRSNVSGERITYQPALLA
jgi:hypothetical protein